jgi:hypothetical protein
MFSVIFEVHPKRWARREDMSSPQAQHLYSLSSALVADRGQPEGRG